MSNSVNLALDVTKTDVQNTSIKIRQGDGGFETLHITVTSNGEPMDLQGWTITFMGTTAGNHKIIDTNVKIVEAPNGIFEYTPSKAWGMDIGYFKIAYFKFVKGDGSASSANFRVNVIEAIDLTQEEARNYISVIDATIVETREHLESSLADVSSSVAATSVAASSMAVNVSNVASSAADNINGVASNAIENVNLVASSAVNNVNVTTSNAIDKVDAATSSYANEIDGVATNAVDKIGSAASGASLATSRAIDKVNSVASSAVNQVNTTNSNAVNQVNSAASSATSQANSAASNVLSVASIAVSNVSSVAAGVVDKLNNIKVGGRNLMLGTADWSGGSSRWNQRASVTNNTYRGTVIAATSKAFNNTPAYAIKNAGILQVGKTYTFSTYVRNTSDTDAKIGYYYETVMMTPSFVDISLPAHTDWTRIFVTFQLLKDTTTSDYGLRWEPKQNVTNGEIQFAGYKLEEGNVATDWTPAPEDAPSNDSQLVHKTGNEVLAGDKSLVGNTTLATTTILAGNYGLRVTPSGFQKTTDGKTWVAANI